MALELTENARELSQQTNIQQQIIIVFEPFPFIFSTLGVTKFARYGDEIVYNQPNLVYGGVIPEPDSRAFISLDGTTNSIKQQIEIDRGGSSSITSFKVRLVDKDGLIVDLFTPNNQYVDDPLGITARVFLNFVGGAHPEDSALFLIGQVVEIDHGAGYADITISSPQAKKRAKAFTKSTTELTGNINSTDTVIPVENTINFLSPQDAIRTYIKINDEIIEVGNRTASSFDVITRGALNTIADNHDNEDPVESFYRLEGQNLELALKLMLSKSGNEPVFTNIKALAFQVLDSLNTVPNAILLESENIQGDYGVVIGDLITVTGATNAQNNITDALIIGFGKIPNQQEYIIVNQNLVDEIGSSAIISINSKYNVLPDGLGMSPLEVDVERHEFLASLFPDDVVDMDFFIDDTITGTSFIDEELYFPAGFYSVPRAGNKASCNITIPPLAVNQVPTLSAANIGGADRIKIKRTTNKYFFNSIVYRFEKDSLDSNFLATNVNISATSIGKINVENKPLTIESNGLRRGSETNLFINRKAIRLLDAYQLSAETIQIDVLYKVGFVIEVADTVIFDGSDLKIVDSRLGSRDFENRVMLVLNKSIDLKKGRITLTLIDTGLSSVGRFGVIGPSSTIDAGSTDTILRLKQGLQIPLGFDESFKWTDYIGENVLVRTRDYSFTEETELLGIDFGSPNTIIVSALTSPPPEDYIVEIINYPDSPNATEAAKWKNVHVFLTPQILITNGINDTEVEINIADVDKLFIGSVVRVHSPDYSNDSQTDLVDTDPEIVSIVGNVITFDKSLGFTPAPNDQIDLIGFSADEGLPYRLI
jgi:hypothetical protein